ncbi:hypothetical protein JCM8547_009233 [Rhodosporidiobolus lusitaniae]
MSRHLSAAVGHIRRRSRSLSRALNPKDAFIRDLEHWEFLEGVEAFLKDMHELLDLDATGRAFSIPDLRYEDIKPEDVVLASGSSPSTLLLPGFDLPLALLPDGSTGIPSNVRPFTSTAPGPQPVARQRASDGNVREAKYVKELREGKRWHTVDADSWRFLKSSSSSSSSSGEATTGPTARWMCRFPPLDHKAPVMELEVHFRMVQRKEHVPLGR